MKESWAHETTADQVTLDDTSLVIVHQYFLRNWKTWKVLKTEAENVSVLKQQLNQFVGLQCKISKNKI